MLGPCDANRMGSFVWMLQWPIRAAVLLLVARLPLGVELDGFGHAFLAAVLIGMLGTILIWPLKVVLGLPWAITSLGGLIWPVTWLFDWGISIVLFGLAAWLMGGFRLRHGLRSAVLGAVVYSVLSAAVLNLLGLEVPFTRS